MPTNPVLRRLFLVAGASLALVALLVPTARPAGPARYRSPLDVALAADGKRLFVSDYTYGAVVVLDADSGKKLAEWPVKGRPSGLALSADGEKLFVVDEGANELVALRTKDGKPAERVTVGLRPTSLCVVPQAHRLFVCNTASDDVSVIDTGSGKEIKRLAAVREPIAAAATPDAKTLVVANALPVGSTDDADLGVDIGFYDIDSLAPKGSVKLPLGSTNARSVVISKDGKWAYVDHTLARFNVPPTQLERGWMNTSAVSIISLAEPKLLTTFLVDELDEGGADPNDMILSPDGQRLLISLGGIHQVCTIDIAKLHELLDGKIPEDLAKRNESDYGSQNVWSEIGKDRAGVLAKLQDDLTALYQAGVRRRWASGGNGPRGLAMSADSTRLFVANYYGGQVAAVDGRGKAVWKTAVGQQPPETQERRGDRLFHDAGICFQHWQSCSTCHPNGRMDALRWDLQNDGMGNPKKTRSLVFAGKQKPVMAMGVRADMAAASAAGVKFILFAVIPDEDQQALNAYILSLRPEASPYEDAKGHISASAQRGKKLFEGKAQCAECHTGDLFSDFKKYDVGTRGQYDKPEDQFFTPRLPELYRTAPYLHDARTPSLKEVLTKYNPEDKHGKTKGLTPQEMDDLVAYMLSL